MTILFSQSLDNFGEAAKLALSEAGVDGVRLQTMELMATLADPSRLRSLAETALDRAVRHKWAKARFHEGKRYYVVVPWLKYDARTLRGSHHNYAVLERDGEWVTWNMAGFDKWKKDLVRRRFRRLFRQLI